MSNYNENELKSIRQTLKEMTDDIVAFHTHFLDSGFMQDFHVSMLYRLGDEAIPGLKQYLIEQAELEKKLVNDLTTYYDNKIRLEKKYRSIVTSRTEPQYLGSNLIADKLTECIKEIEKNRLFFVKKWGNNPTEFCSFSSPRNGPERKGVDGALKVLELIATPTVIPFLLRLIDHSDEIMEKNLPNNYKSVFMFTKKTLREFSQMKFQ